jgi:ketosteroid isomerase-like protein
MAARDPALQAMLDKEEIKEVLHDYCRGVDRGDVELLRSVYHEDAIDDHGIWKGRGVDFGPWITEQLGKNARTSHNVMNIKIDLRGDVAFSETYCIAVSDEPTIRRTVFNRYVDRIERRNGKWKIAHRIVVFDVNRGDPPAKPPDMGPGLTWGTRDKTDPSYRR